MTTEFQLKLQLKLNAIHQGRLKGLREGTLVLDSIPKALRTPELYLAAVQKDGWALEHVPETLRTPELCLIAVQQKGDDLEHVPFPVISASDALQAYILDHFDELVVDTSEKFMARLATKLESEPARTDRQRG